MNRVASVHLVEGSAMDDFRLMADALESEIRTGALRAGKRLLPQREFARERGIATSTAARVYQELVRRGLVSGEIGRGTFVLPGLVLSNASQPDLIDLEANFPVLPAQPAMVAQALSKLFQPLAMAAALDPVGVAGSARDRTVLSSFLTRRSWTPEPASVLFASGGRQAIAAAIASLVPFGGRLGVEELTYPIVKSIAAHQGVTLVPVKMDSAGLIPQELAAAHGAAPLQAVYLQPSLHNPLGVSMPVDRLAELAAVIRTLSLPVIEDGVNSFLRDDLPFAAIAPERVIYVDSLAKRLAPGLNLGVISAPAWLRDRLATTVRSGAWACAGFALAACTALIADGTAGRIVAAKRSDAAVRQKIVLDRLAEFQVTGDPGAYHLWWELPEPWRAETFVAAAARQGISVSPAASFAVRPGQAPNAVRISNSSPVHKVLIGALETLAGLARKAPEDTELRF
jgi:DNA-binding transcriptional MocR family regulator